MMCDAKGWFRFGWGLVALGCALLWSTASVTSASAPFVWEPGNGFRSAKLNVPTSGKTGFQKLDAPQLGILFTNHVSKTRSILNRNLLNGSGVAVGDIDGDGL